MAVIFKNGDMFTSDAQILCHQVNCMGRMGSGIAKTVREKFPNVYESYMHLCHSGMFAPDELLGRTLICKCGDKSMANLFAQLNYGYDGKLYTSYEAFHKCLRSIKRSVPKGSSIAFPYGIGCGLGGGKWEIIISIIYEELGNDYEVEVWKYEKNA